MGKLCAEVSPPKEYLSAARAALGVRVKHAGPLAPVMKLLAVIGVQSVVVKRVVQPMIGVVRRIRQSTAKMFAGLDHGDRDRKGGSTRQLDNQRGGGEAAADDDNVHSLSAGGMLQFFVRVSHCASMSPPRAGIDITFVQKWRAKLEQSPVACELEGIN